MIATETVNTIAAEVSRAKLGSRAIVRVMSGPTVDSGGREALQITIVIAPKALSGFSGEKVVDTLYEIQNRLLERGEERFPIIEYATAEELAESGAA